MNGEAKGKGPGIKQSCREECKISSRSEHNKYEHRLMSLDLRRREMRRAKKGGVKKGTVEGS